MKFIEKIFVIFCFISLILIGTAFAETGTVNVSATRLRKENNTDSDIITNIYKDDKVEILGEAGEWYQIEYDGKTGYVKKEYITVSKKSNSSENKTKLENTTNTSSSNTTSSKSNTNNKSNSNTSSNDKKNSNTSNENSSTNNSNNVTTTLENNESSALPTNLDKNTVITNSLASLRNIPSMLSVSIAQIEQSKQLTKLNEMGNWIQVTDGNVKGWISRSKVIVGTQEPISSNDFTNSNTENQNAIENKISSNNTANKDTNTVNKNNTNRNTTSNETAINKTGVINVETAKVRESASSSAKVKDFLDYNDKVEIIAEDGEWYKITSSKASGYVNKKLITVSSEKEQVSSRTLTENRELDKDNTVVDQSSNENLTNSINNSNSGNEVAEYAKQYLGTAYVVGGKNPNSGFDCSGFTKYVYSNFGYTLGSTASSQTNIGSEISRDNLQVGDLILFYNESKTSIGHTGIYIGNGEFIHAANPKRGVVTDNLNTSSYYNERFVSARRIVN